MRIDQALDFLHASNAAQFESLSDRLPPELITSLLGEGHPAPSPHAHGATGLGHHRLAIFRHVPMIELVNQLDIILSGERLFVAPRAFVQVRQKLGHKSIAWLFHDTAARWYQQANHPAWAGQQLLAVDGVMWRTPDTPDNAATFAKPGSQHGETAYPQVHIICHMEPNSNLLTQAIREICAINEMVLAEQLIERTATTRSSCTASRRRDTTGSVGRVVGVQPAVQPDGEDGGIHGESVEFSHGVGVPHS